jgi:(2S)-methylsuccinyl-CoA dehydrogenase
MTLAGDVQAAGACARSLPHILAAADRVLHAARQGVTRQVGRAGGIDPVQHAAHGLAWLATCVEALRQLARWAGELEQAGRYGEIERLITALGARELARQIATGIAMSPGEFVRPVDLGVPLPETRALEDEVERTLPAYEAVAERARLAVLVAADTRATTFGDTGLDETHAAMREQMWRFAREAVVPHAHGWHLANALIPDEVIAKLSALGAFGVSIPEGWGGLGLGKEAMCVVSEELSRGYIGVGSLGTRSEIAAELILAHGSDAQKQRYLPRIAAGEILPTAVFTEPDTGSDLAGLRTRAVRDGDVWRITGQKTWTTHGARADLMTLLVRTDPSASGYKGLSMLLAEKPRGTDADPFPAPGMSGSEIEVLGYRGMKEYEIAFEDFVVPADALLGGADGPGLNQGFKQLMSSFEAARIQTAARAIGVAQSALDLALAYAQERRQFGRALYAFPRVADKIVAMVVEIMIARQLTCFAARAKDQGRRCDLEAGMAKLYAARVAWSAADNAVQIHGGNGFALEYPISRILCDARILSIFEGAAEIQAQVIARRLI